MEIEAAWGPLSGTPCLHSMSIDRDDQWLCRMTGYGRNVPAAELVRNADSPLAHCPLWAAVQLEPNWAA
jgi:hypothetical protein